MGIITGILIAIALYGVLWFIVVQYNAAMRNTRQKAFADGKNQGFKDGFIRHYEVSERIKARPTLSNLPEWYNPMPDDVLEKLNDISLGDAMDRGLIFKAGDEKDFIKVYREGEIVSYYAIIDGYTLRTSIRLAKLLSETEDENLLSTVLFSKGNLEYENGEFQEFKLYLPNL